MHTKNNQNHANNGQKLADNTGMDESTNNLAQVRDILFGSQIRDMDQRFSSMEDQIGQQIALVTDDFRRRCDSFESFVKAELDSIATKITQEREERTSACRKISTEVDRLADDIATRVDQLNEKLSQTERRLREHFQEESKGIRDEMQEKENSLRRKIESETAELNNEKMDRLNLSEMFREMAVRLSNEPEI